MRRRDPDVTWFRPWGYCQSLLLHCQSSFRSPATSKCKFDGRHEQHSFMAMDPTIHTCNSHTASESVSSAIAARIRVLLSSSWGSANWNTFRAHPVSLKTSQSPFTTRVVILLSGYVLQSCLWWGKSKIFLTLKTISTITPQRLLQEPQKVIQRLLSMFCVCTNV